MNQNLYPIDVVLRWRRLFAHARPGSASVLVLLLVAGLVGCSNHHTGRRESPEQSTATIFSPNGEPLNGGPLGYPSCKDAMTGWFHRVDTKHDGAMDLNEYLADSRRQFAVMDLNRDGEITPAELADYRAPYNVDMPESSPQQDEAADQDETSGQRNRRGGSGQHISSSTKVDISNDMADPVMSADVDLKFQVSLDQFLAYQKKQFVELDIHHRGYLTLEDILSRCPVGESR